MGATVFLKKKPEGGKLSHVLETGKQPQTLFFFLYIPYDH